MKKILVVEDELDVAELVADVLSLHGYTAHIASGEEAQKETLSFRPDAILLDLMMPDVDGFEVARRLRADSQTQDIPIVIMTAMHDVAIHADKIGTSHFLAKPFDIDVLIEIVAEVTT